MKRPTKKFDKLPWLLFTQLVEVIESPNKTHTSKELADIVWIALEAMEKMGFDPWVVCSRRWDSKSAERKRIVERYQNAYEKVTQK